MPEILGFEETPLLIKPYESDGAFGDSFVAMSPNFSKESLRQMDKADIFYFYPNTGFTLECIEQKKVRHVKGPRDYDKFAEGVDNLCPGVYLREVIYTPLVTSDGMFIGVLQLINKTTGFATDDDISLAGSISTVIANSLLMVMKASKLSGTMDHIIMSVANATKDS